MSDTTTSQRDSDPSQTTGDVNAILQGMTDAQIDQILRRRGQTPDQLQPGYRPQMPTALQPQQQPAWPPISPTTGRPMPTYGYHDPSGNYVTGPPGTTVQPPGQPVPGSQPGQIPPELQPRRQPGDLNLYGTTAQPVPPEQVALNQPGPYSLGHQPGPWPAANPNSPVFRSAQEMPALPGETPQETAALNGFAWRESNGQNIINSLAAKNPALYYDPRNPRTAGGYWQDVNGTWATGARLAGVDTRQFPTAMSADYWTQRRVNLALYRAHGDAPWRADSNAGELGDREQLRDQYPLPAQPRSYQDWGKDPQLTAAPPRDFGPGPSGQQQTGFTPQQPGYARVLNAVGPLLLGIASLALRLPLSTAITAYGAMARAQDNGQREAYNRARTQHQDELNEATAQQTRESRDASDAFVEYGNNNPEGLQQRLAQIALQYNDPTMFRMAERGDLNGIHQLQQQRDLYNQDLLKLHTTQDAEQRRQDEQAAVRALDHQWEQDPANRNATDDQRAIAHAEHVAQVQREFAGKGEGTGVENAIYDVTDPEGKPTGRQVQRDKNGHLLDMNGQPTTVDPSKERLKPVSTKQETEGPKPSDYKDYTWEDQQGQKHGPSSAAIIPGKGLVDPQGNPIDAKPGTIRAVGTRETQEGPKASDYKDYTWEDSQGGKHGPALAALVPGQGLVDSRGNPIDAKPESIRAVGTGERTGAQPQFGSQNDLMQRWHEQFVKDNNREPTTDEIARKAQEFRQEAKPPTGAPTRFGTVDDLMQRWHEQFVKDNGREPSTDEISKQRQTFTQESKPPAQSARQVSQRLGIAIGEAAGGIDALSRLSSQATLGPWGGAQAALSTNSFENFGKSLANRVTPRESRMLNSIAAVIARPLASVEAAGVATGLVGVTDSLRREFPQSGDDGFTVLTKMANLRNIIDAASDQLVLDKTIAPEIRDLIAQHRDQVDAAIPYTLTDVIAAETNPTAENMRGLAERLLHRAPTQGQGGQGRGTTGLPPGVTVEVK